ncbi:hypothetical protein JCM3766R1_004937 [Sporobolomyces carnicolor]
MVCTVEKSWGWNSFAKKEKPEWKDIAARLAPRSQDEPVIEKNEAKEKPRRRRRKSKKVVVKDYPFSSNLKLLDLPGEMRVGDCPARNELLDLVLGDESLNLRDHLAVAATCRSFRACYMTFSDVDPNASSNSRHSILWSGLVKVRPMPRQAIRRFEPVTTEQDFAVRHIWTNGPVDPHDEDEVKALHLVRVLPANWNLTKAGKPRKRKRRMTDGDDKEGDLGIKSKEWNEAIETVNYYRMTKTQAQSVYKLKGDELETYLYAFCKPNPHGKRTAPAVKCYLEASVESLAYRLHGGVEKHYQLVKKRETMASKARATRVKNGTTHEQVAKRRRVSERGQYRYYGCG